MGHKSHKRLTELNPESIFTGNPGEPGSPGPAGPVGPVGAKGEIIIIDDRFEL